MNRVEIKEMFNLLRGPPTLENGQIIDFQVLTESYEIVFPESKSFHFLKIFQKLSEL